MVKVKVKFELNIVKIGSLDKPMAGKLQEGVTSHSWVVRVPVFYFEADTKSFQVKFLVPVTSISLDSHSQSSGKIVRIHQHILHLLQYLAYLRVNGGSIGRGEEGQEGEEKHTDFTVDGHAGAGGA